MNILISYEHGGSALRPISVEEFCKDALRFEGAPENCEVSVTFVSNDKIRRLNREYRGIDKPTDVLSFECDGAIVEQGAEVCLLGDIVIAPDVAREQCDEFGNSFIDEIELLLAHGILHLLGYDHVEDDEAEVMEAKEREIISLWKGRSSKRIVHHAKVDAPLPILNSFKFALAGVKYTFETQRNMKIHMCAAAFAILISFGLNIGLANVAIVVLCCSLVISLELVNTALESVVDLASPEWHSMAKHAKDCAAAGVLIAAIASLLVAACIFLPKILDILSSTVS